MPGIYFLRETFYWLTMKQGPRGEERCEVDELVVLTAMALKSLRCVRFKILESLETYLHTISVLDFFAIISISCCTWRNWNGIGWLRHFQSIFCPRKHSKTHVNVTRGNVVIYKNHIKMPATQHRLHNNISIRWRLTHMVPSILLMIRYPIVTR